MMKQTRKSDLMMFAKIAKVDKGTSAAEVPMRVLVPAFVTSELKTAFQIGFMLFLPFLVIDSLIVIKLSWLYNQVKDCFWISFPVVLVVLV